MAKQLGSGKHSVFIIHCPPDPGSTGSASVQVPTSGGRGSGGTSGFLCAASGIITFPATGINRITGAYFVITNEMSASSHLGTWVKANRQYFLPSTAIQISWSLPKTLYANCGTGPSANNTLYVVGSYYDSTYHEQFTAVETASFLGTPCSSCTVTGSSIGFAPGSGPPPVPSIDTNQIGPVDCDGDWLLYRLSASHDGNGNVLTRNGNILQANVIAVAAANVYWRHGENPSYVRRAIGDIFPATNDYQFPGLPANGIVISQIRFPALGHDHRAVISECRERPDIFHVKPDFPLTVQVNYPNIDGYFREGSFDLWVKVID
jgi:hypothetical protein